MATGLPIGLSLWVHSASGLPLASQKMCFATNAGGAALPLVKIEPSEMAAREASAQNTTIYCLGVTPRAAAARAPCIGCLYLG